MDTGRTPSVETVLMSFDLCNLAGMLTRELESLIENNINDAGNVRTLISQINRLASELDAQTFTELVDC